MLRSSALSRGPGERPLRPLRVSEVQAASEAYKPGQRVERPRLRLSSCGSVGGQATDPHSVPSGDAPSWTERGTSQYYRKNV